MGVSAARLARLSARSARWAVAFLDVLLFFIFVLIEYTIATTTISAIIRIRVRLAVAGYISVIIVVTLPELLLEDDQLLSFTAVIVAEIIVRAAGKITEIGESRDVQHDERAEQHSKQSKNFLLQGGILSLSFSMRDICLKLIFNLLPCMAGTARQTGSGSRQQPQNPGSAKGFAVCSSRQQALSAA